MTKHTIVIIADYSKQEPLTLDEICEICQTSPDFIYTLIDYGVISPDGEYEQEWLFDLTHLQRVKTAMRLHHDLEINLPGVALVLDLLDEIEELRKRAELLEHNNLP